jgi:hypothetical protein
MAKDPNLPAREKKCEDVPMQLPKSRRKLPKETLLHLLKNELKKEWEKIRGREGSETMKSENLQNESM